MRGKSYIRKALALLLTATMVLAGLPAGASAASSDITGHWAEKTLEKWSDLGWFTGDGAGAYRPNASITRAEFAALVNRMKGYSGESADIAGYRDVSPGKWYYGAISTALAAGYMTGVDAGSMAPEKPITRQEAITIISRVEGISATDADQGPLSSAVDGNDVASWARDGVAAGIEAGLVSGAAGRINPAADITRAESVVLMDRIYANAKAYAFAGSYGPESGVLNASAVDIAGSGVRLQNASVSGDLTITSAVGDGDVYLDGVKVAGALIVLGGGYNSIHLTDCDIHELDVEKSGVRVVLGGNSSVAILNAEASGARIETQAGTSIGTANISAETEITGPGSIAIANISAAGVVIEAKPNAVNVAEGIAANVGGATVGSAAEAETPAVVSSGGGGGGGNTVETVWLKNLSNPFIGEWQSEIPSAGTLIFDYRQDGTFGYEMVGVPAEQGGIGEGGYVVFDDTMITYLDFEGAAGYKFKVIDNNTIEVTEYEQILDGNGEPTGNIELGETAQFTRVAGSTVNMQNLPFVMDHAFLDAWQFDGEEGGLHYFMVYRINADGSFTVDMRVNGMSAGQMSGKYFIFGDTIVMYLDGMGFEAASISSADENTIIVAEGNESSVMTRYDGGTPITAALVGDGSFGARGVNYVLLSVAAGNYADADYSINGEIADARKVLADGSLVKVPVPAGAKDAALSVTQGGRTVLNANITFDAPGAAAPVTLYGTVPMAFSEFFHDITANINTVEPMDTAFAANGTVAEPIKFITQGTRTGSPTYADGDKLAKVDVVSSATYGDDVHFVPNGNLTLDDSDRKQKTDQDAAILGITKVEVGVSFDLLANALLLADAGRGTAQSANVLAKADKLTLTAIKYADGSFTDGTGNAIAAPPIYKPKYMLIDGNWGKRAESALNESVVKSLPGTDVEMEDVAYGGNWGDKVTGVTFGTLESEYSGASYWDNFAEYLYGGYIEDSNGHREPLVFLQNIFSHRMHEDFDIAVSPSRFARLGNLKTPDTYTVHVYAYGFEDIESEIYMKDYMNGGVTIDTASYKTTPGGIDANILISGIDDFDGYDTARFSIEKGASAVSTSDYAVVKEGGKLKLTLKSSLFTGAFQGAYTVRIVPDTDAVASKTLSFTLVKLIEHPQLTLNADRTSEGADATQDEPIAVQKSDGKLYFTNDEFAAALITSGRSGFTSIKEVDGGAAVAIGAAARSDAAGQPYYFDLTNAAFEAGKTYEITANATGFEAQTYYITLQQ